MLRCKYAVIGTSQAFMTPRKRRIVAILLIILIGISPFISVFIASVIADAHGCRLDEAATYPCVVGGRDVGDLLGAMSLMGWAGLITIPSAVSVLFWWGVVALVRLILRRNRRAGGLPPGH
jgi:ABC-type enterochelin transport system permease subunit